MSVNDNRDAKGREAGGRETGGRETGGREPDGHQTSDGKPRAGGAEDALHDGATSRAELEGEKLPDPDGAEAEGGIAEILDADVDLPPEDPRVSEVAALQEEVGKLKDQLLRTMAEQENAQKRHAKDREDAVKYAASKFAKDMLDVADNLRRAIDSATQGPKREDLPEPIRNLIEGIEATERSLLQAFERNGIRRIEAMGEKFNPNLHEAMFEVEHPEQPAGTVVQVLAPGYTIADRLLRPAQVGVSRGGQSQPRVDTKA